MFLTWVVSFLSFLVAFKDIRSPCLILHDIFGNALGTGY